MGATIKVTISKGEILAEVNGVQGLLCEQLSIVRALREAAGGEVTVETKPEYFVELEGTEIQVHETEE